MISNKKISINQIDSSSLTPITAFNTFTSSYNTGSFTGSFTGSLEGTASFALSASYADVSASLGYLPLNEDFSSLPTASLPLSSSDTLVVNQSGVPKEVAVSELGNSEKEIQCFWSSINWGGALNTWRTWSVNTSNIYFGGPNQTLGTGIEPTKVGTWFADTNVIKLRNIKQIKKFIMSIRNEYTIRTYETFFVVADYTVARGNEPNGQIISNTTFSTGAGSNYIEITPNVHSDLNENSVLYLIFRQTAGPVYQFEGIDFKIIAE